MQRINKYNLIAVNNTERKTIMTYDAINLEQAKKYFSKVYTGKFFIEYFCKGKTGYQSKKVNLRGDKERMKKFKVTIISKIVPVTYVKVMEANSKNEIEKYFGFDYILKIEEE